MPQPSQSSSSSTLKTKPKPKPNLLIPTKRPLQQPTKRTRHLNPSSHPASISIKTKPESTPTRESTPDTAPESASQRRRKEAVVTEVDLANAPQLFLEPGVWNRVRNGVFRVGDAGGRVDEGVERGSEAEFGGMAVRSRRSVRGGGRGRARGRGRGR